MSKHQPIIMGSLKALVAQKSSKPLFNVVLFHGYGANALNLYPLSRYLDVDVKWIFPEGLDPIAEDPHGPGRTWFPVNVEEFLEDKDNYMPSAPGLDLIVDEAYQAFKSLPNLIIGGFSQGAILAINLIMKTDLNVKALIVLSGALLDRENWHQHKIREGLPFFQSHGRSDTLLNYLAGQRLESALIGYGLKGQLFGFDGGHEIPQDVLTQLQKFLDSFISSGS